MIQFFFGTPRRGLISSIVIVFLLGCIFPEETKAFLERGFQAFLGALSPFIEPALTLALFVFVIGWLFKSAMPKK